MSGGATRHVEHVMGTLVSLDLRGGGDRAAGVVEAVAWFHEVDRRFSPYRPDSEVRRIAEIADPSPDLRFVLEACDALRARTDGSFDAWLPDGAFDPSAFVKGWSVDRAAAILEAHGCHDFCINAGGDVLTRGRPVPGGVWRIGIQHPTDRASVATVVEGTALAVATSGEYERGQHIRDPRTGSTPQGVLSVTVSAADLGTADALSTAGFARGAEAAAWLAGQPGVEAFVITADGRTLTTAGFPVAGSPLPVTAVPGDDPFGLLAVVPGSAARFSTPESSGGGEN